MKIKKIEFVREDLKKTDFYNQDIRDVEEFRFWNCKNLDLNFLKNAKKMKVLEVLNFPGENFSALSGLVDLEILRVIHIPKLKTLQGLRNLKNLKELEISTNPSWDSQKKFFEVDDIREVFNIKGLQKVSLLGFYIKSFNEVNIIKNFKNQKVRISGFNNLIKEY